MNTLGPRAFSYIRSPTNFLSKSLDLCLDDDSVAMAFVTYTCVFLLEPKVRLTSTLDGMGHRRGLGSSHVVARGGWVVAPLFPFFGL